MGKGKILIIYHKISYGGANKSLAFVANALAENGFTVILYTYSSNEKPVYSLNNRIKLIRETKHSGKKVTDRWNQIKRVAQIAKTENPDLLLSFMSTSNLYAVLIGKLLKIPMVISERGNPAKESERLLSRIKQFLMNFSVSAVFQTEDAKKHYSKKLQSRSLVIPNTASKTTISLKPWEKREKVICFVSRFEIINKRHDLMLLAFHRVLKYHPEYKLYFYGDGEDMNYVNELVISLNLRDNVEFKGRIDNVLEEISKSRVFVLTSDNEGIPNALIEAMSLGLPCVATDCEPGGARLLIENDFNGLIVPKGNYVAIADAIIFMLDNPIISTEMGNNAKLITDDFSESNIKKMWIDHIESIISK